MAMTKMTIQSNGGTFELKINPAAIKFDKKIKYKSFNLFGTPTGLIKYDAHSPSTLSFEFILDATGIACEKKETGPQAS